MQKRVYILLLLLNIGIFAIAKSTKTIEGSYTYYAPPTMSMQQAEQEAIRRAQINALAKAFGSVIVENTTSILTEQDELFYQEGNSLVKGEWIETIGEPKIERGLDDNSFWVKCTIKGKAREIVSARTDIDVKVLCNHPDVNFEHTDFKNGDRLYVSIKTAENGYITIFLYDKKADSVSCLLPYPRDNNSVTAIMRDKKYVLFSKSRNELPAKAVEYVMNCTDAIETNTLYVLFSKKVFSKPSLNDNEGAIKNLSYSRFQRWLTKCQSEDETFQVIRKNINISKE